MEYRNLGKTNLKLSRLGFGCMRLPALKNGKTDEEKAVKILREGYEKGINYFDTGDIYMGHTSEQTVAKAIEPFRKNVYLSTKTHSNFIFNGFKTHFEERLKIFGYVDVYHIWHASLADFKKIEKEGKTFDFLYRQKKEGNIKFIALSFHDEEPDNVKYILDYGILDSILFSYNLLNYKMHEKWIEYAHKKGIGTIAMNPVGGGVLADLPAETREKYPDVPKNNTALALKYVFNNPCLDVAISGMGSGETVDFNTKIASSDYSLTQEDLNLISKLREEKGEYLKLFCTGCKYCFECPKEIDIPFIFKLYNQALIYNVYEKNKEIYKGVKFRGGDCISCKACEKACPQHLKIARALHEIEEYFK